MRERERERERPRERVREREPRPLTDSPYPLASFGEIPGKKTRSGAASDEGLGTDAVDAVARAPRFGRLSPPPGKSLRVALHEGNGRKHSFTMVSD